MEVVLRGEDHPDGPLVLRRTPDGRILLDEPEAPADIVSLGKEDDELRLIAKCLTYVANWDTSETYRELSLETLLRKIVHEHRTGEVKDDDPAPGSNTALNGP